MRSKEIKATGGREAELISVCTLTPFIEMTVRCQSLSCSACGSSWKTEVTHELGTDFRETSQPGRLLQVSRAQSLLPSYFFFIGKPMEHSKVSLVSGKGFWILCSSLNRADEGSYPWKTQQHESSVCSTIKATSGCTTNI